MFIFGTIWFQQKLTCRQTQGFLNLMKIFYFLQTKMEGDTISTTTKVNSNYSYSATFSGTPEEIAKQKKKMQKQMENRKKQIEKEQKKLLKQGQAKHKKK